MFNYNYESWGKNKKCFTGKNKLCFSLHLTNFRDITSLSAAGLSELGVMYGVVVVSEC